MSVVYTVSGWSPIPIFLEMYGGCDDLWVFPSLTYCFVRVKRYYWSRPQYNLGSILKPNSPTKSLRKRIRELKKVSTRIEAKMGKLEKLIASMSSSVGGETIDRRSRDRGLQSRKR